MVANKVSAMFLVTPLFILSFLVGVVGLFFFGCFGLKKVKSTKLNYIPH